MRTRRPALRHSLKLHHMTHTQLPSTITLCILSPSNIHTVSLQPPQHIPPAPLAIAAFSRSKMRSSGCSTQCLCYFPRPPICVPHSSYAYSPQNPCTCPLRPLQNPHASPLSPCISRSEPIGGAPCAMCLLCTSSAVSANVMGPLCSMMGITLCKLHATHAHPSFSTEGIVSKKPGE